MPLTTTTEPSKIFTWGLIPPFFLDCIVAIGLITGDGSKQWVATGFIYGEFVKTISEEQRQYRIFLVTNRHVLEGKEKCYIRVNVEGNEPAREYDLPLRNESGKQVWFANPDPEIDIAIIPFDLVS